MDSLYKISIAVVALAGVSTLAYYLYKKFKEDNMKKEKEEKKESEDDEKWEDVSEEEKIDPIHIWDEILVESMETILSFDGSVSNNEKIINLPKEDKVKILAIYLEQSIFKIMNK